MASIPSSRARARWLKAVSPSRSIRARAASSMRSRDMGSRGWRRFPAGLAVLDLDTDLGTDLGTDSSLTTLRRKVKLDLHRKARRRYHEARTPDRHPDCRHLAGPVGARSPFSGTPLPPRAGLARPGCLLSAALPDRRHGGAAAPARLAAGAKRARPLRAGDRGGRGSGLRRDHPGRLLVPPRLPPVGRHVALAPPDAP